MLTRACVVTLAAAAALIAFPGGAAAEGSFSASDPLLGQIWASSVSTARKVVSDPVDIPDNCPLPKRGKVILDGVVRDRCMWIGDLAVTGKTLFAADGAAGSPVADAIRLFADAQTPAGVIPPTTGPLGELLLVDYTAYWIEVLRDYVLFSGDLASGRRHFPHVVRALDGWYPSQMAGRLFVDDLHRDYMLVDRRDTVVAYYNAQHIRALDLAAELAGWLGERGAASRWAERAATLRPAVQDAFWDVEAGAYRDTLRGPLLHSQDGNAFAVLAGVGTRRHSLGALSYLSASNGYDYGNSIADNESWDGYPWGDHTNRRVYPFMSYFEVVARYHVGLEVSALDLIRRCWGYMVRNGPGTTWETIGPFGGGPVHGSWAHGWSTGAAPALTAYVLGVRPTSPGFATFVVEPRTAGLAWAKGVVPTPRGNLSVAWRIAGGELRLDVTAPAGTRWENEPQARRSAEVRKTVVPATIFVRVPLLAGSFRLR